MAGRVTVHVLSEVLDASKKVSLLRILQRKRPDVDFVEVRLEQSRE